MDAAAEAGTSSSSSDVPEQTLRSVDKHNIKKVGLIPSKIP